MSSTTTILSTGLPSLLQTGTVTSHFNLPVRKDCIGECLLDPRCGWNCLHCRADLDYWQFYCISDPEPSPACLPLNCPATDDLNFLFSRPDDFNNWNSDTPATHGWSASQTGDWLATVEVYDATDPCNPILCEEASFVTYAKQYYVGGLPNGSTYQGIIIDPTTLPCKFMLKFIFNRASGEAEACWTEPYEKAQCVHTVVIEGVYAHTGQGSTDCNGKFYGIPTGNNSSLGSPFFYSNAIRLGGALYHKGVDVTKEVRENFEITQNPVISSYYTDSYLLRLSPIPPYMVTKLTMILNARQIYINGELYEFIGSVDKGRDIGEMWSPDIELRKIGCKITKFDCTDTE